MTLKDNIHAFVADFVCASVANEHTSARTVRDFFQVEVKGFSEFIGVNGKVYRYGFVSEDAVRTRTLARALFDNDLNKFRDIVGMKGMSSWDDLQPAKLKVHLQRNHDAAVALNSSVLPAPLSDVNPPARNWLQGIYENIARLNVDWATDFQRWEDVTFTNTEAQRESVRDATRSDMRNICALLSSSTKSAMMVEMGLKGEVEHLFNELTVPHIPDHGEVEVLLATLAAQPSSPAAPDTLFTMLLLYLAHSVAHHTFTPLPLGVRTVTSKEAARDRAVFLEHYYDTTTRTVQDDWGRIMGTVTTAPLDVLVLSIPASTLKNLDEFVALSSTIAQELKDKP